MKNISLVIGETASLPKELKEKHQMKSVPYTVDWPQGDDLPGDNIYQKMREAQERGISELPKTSQPPPSNFKEIFEEELENSKNIICTTLSSKLSGGYNSARMARSMLEEEQQSRISIVDSYNVTIGEGLFNLKVAELIEKENDVEKVLKKLENLVSELQLIGFLKDIQWIERGGRISHSLSLLVAQMQKLGMRPLLELKEGEIKPLALRRRAKDIPSALFKELKRNLGEPSAEKGSEQNSWEVSIGHADNLEDAENLKNLMEKELKNVKVRFISLMDPVIGVHAGPGSLLCAWVPQQPFGK